MTVESTTQALCDLALRFGEGDEESMVMNYLALKLIFMCLVAYDVIMACGPNSS